MSEALFARAWVLVLGSAAAGLTVASWARADLFASASADGAPPAVAQVAPAEVIDVAPDDSPPVVYGAPSQVPSDLVVATDGSALAGSGEPALAFDPASANVAAAPAPVAPLGEAIPAGATPIVVPPVAAPADVPPPATRVATDDEPCNFSLTRSELTRAIVDQRAAPATSPFEADGRPLYLWIETNNIEGRGQGATFRWVHEPTETVYATTLELAISARWRTWTEVSLPPTSFGPWRVEVIDNQGCQVEILRFEMLPRGW
jgi:hypothetical protein